MKLLLVPGVRSIAAITSATATGGKAPDNVKPLDHDIFTSKDFYSDRDLWMDKRYYRCNSPIALDSIWGDYTSGPGAIENSNPATAAWGHCERDYPREAIVSPSTSQPMKKRIHTRARGGSCNRAILVAMKEAPQTKTAITSPKSALDLLSCSITVY